MKNTQPNRAYNMTARAEQVAENENRILQAVVDLWKEMSINDITLEKVAERSGLTVRTVLRKFGSKEGLLEASLTYEIPEFEARRKRPTPGNVDEALRTLLDEYEDMGDAVIRTIVASDDLGFAARLLERGRREHRAWCQRVFAPHLPDPCLPAYEIRLSALIAATEIYLWKLLRRDMGHTFDETLEIFTVMVYGIIKQPTR